MTDIIPRLIAAGLTPEQAKVACSVVADWIATDPKLTSAYRDKAAGGHDPELADGYDVAVADVIERLRAAAC